MITTKDNLYLNLLEYCEANRINVFDYVPLTYVLDSANNSKFFDEQEKFQKVFKLFGEAKDSSIEELNTKLGQVRVTGTDRKI